MPNWQSFSLMKLIKNWQFFANNGFKLHNHLTSGMRLILLPIGILSFKTRFDLTDALTMQTKIVISVRRRQLSNDQIDAAAL